MSPHSLFSDPAVFLDILWLDPVVVLYREDNFVGSVIVAIPCE